MDQANARDDLPAAGRLLFPQICVLRRLDDLVIATATPTIIDFDEAVHDESPEGLGLVAMWASGTPSRITLNEDGYWTYFAYISVTTPALYQLDARILINGTGFQGEVKQTYSGPEFGLNPKASRMLSLNDYLQLQVTHQAGVNVTLSYALLGAFRSQEDK